MTEERLEDKLKKLIITRLRLEKSVEDIDETQPLFGEGLGLDSIDALELVVGLEEEFNITIPDEDVGKEAAESLIKEIESKAPVDSHTTDNLIPFLAMFGGQIKVSNITKHTKTNIWVCEQFLEKKFEIDEENNVINLKQ